MRDGAKVKLGRMFEKTSQAGRRYFVGRLGAARVLLFDSGEKGDDGSPIWELYAQESEDVQARGEGSRRIEAQGYAGAAGRGDRPGPADDGQPFHDDPLDDALPIR